MYFVVRLLADAFSPPHRAAATRLTALRAVAVAAGGGRAGVGVGASVGLRAAGVLMRHAGPRRADVWTRHVNARAWRLHAGAGRVDLWEGVTHEAGFEHAHLLGDGLLLPVPTDRDSE